ncbi:hypothetical protein Taro_025385 [Colocasia esculenta]|uniref:Uncharacterized protein n=1 Tax=Colocasia esculenta TaxID=4460 RepID=A0A843VKC9_COLES|nr:hypothetical protein [Colocasia esculenta]
MGEEEVDREKETAISLILPFYDQDRDKGETAVFFFFLLILLRSGQGQGANDPLLLLLLIRHKIGAAAAGPLPPPFLRPVGAATAVLRGGSGLLRKAIVATPNCIGRELNQFGDPTDCFASRDCYNFYKNCASHELA